MNAVEEEALTTAIIEGDDLRLHALLDDLHVEGAGDTDSGDESRDVDVNEAGDKEVLWPLLAAVKCRKPAVVVALVERHHVRSRCDARGRSELHALAESQRGPFPPLPERLTVNGSKWTAAWDLLSVRQLLKRPPAASPPASVEVGLWQALMRAGALPFQGDEFGATPFHIACSRGNWPAVHHLLKSNTAAAVNQQDVEGETGLHWAARSGRQDVVALLLAHSATAASGEGTNGTPAQSGHERIAQMIEAKAESDASPLLAMPWEVVLHVLSFLDPYDLCVVAQACSAMNELSSDDALWRRFCGTDKQSTDEGVDVGEEEDDEETTARSRHVWKTRYMAWLRPNLRQLGQSQAVVDEDVQVLLEAKHKFRPSRVNVIIVGDAQVGKSQLFCRYVRRDEAPASYSPTIGVDYANKSIMPPGSAPLALQIWDTSGQERFQTITSAYFRGAHVFVLVYNVESAESLAGTRDRWAPLIKQFGQSVSPIILVGIQDPEEQRLARAVSEADGRAVAREIGALYCAEVSLSHRAAIESLFERVGCAALGLYDPFAPLRDPALRAKAEAWHVPSAELCSQLLARAKTKAQQSRATSSSSTGATCVLQ